jgi:hypothetical protein
VREPRVVVARLVQPGARQLGERPQHARRAEVDAVPELRVARFDVERVQRPPARPAQRVVRLTRDRPDRRLDLRRVERLPVERLMSAHVEQHRRVE